MAVTHAIFSRHPDGRGRGTRLPAERPGPNLRRQEAAVVALIISDVENPFFTAIARVVRQVTPQQLLWVSTGASVLIAGSNDSASTIAVRPLVAEGPAWTASSYEAGVAPSWPLLQRCEMPAWAPPALKPFARHTTS